MTLKTSGPTRKNILSIIYNTFLNIKFFIKFHVKVVEKIQFCISYTKLELLDSFFFKLHGK